ncbi:hypothetical protein FRC06_000852 [Ceratobasidium sp. 370]|nr:hypothetical protein FRC06_000852 [Ceratobasidium sp. 370]
MSQEELDNQLLDELEAEFNSLIGSRGDDPELDDAFVEQVFSQVEGKSAVLRAAGPGRYERADIDLTGANRLAKLKLSNGRVFTASNLPISSNILGRARAYGLNSGTQPYYMRNLVRNYVAVLISDTRGRVAVGDIPLLTPARDTDMSNPPFLFGSITAPGP